MKSIKKMFAVLLSVAMVLMMAMPAFAQTVALDPADEDNAKITINNI